MSSAAVLPKFAAQARSGATQSSTGSTIKFFHLQGDSIYAHR